MPVVATANTNSPSWPESRAATAFQCRSSLVFNSIFNLDFEMDFELRLALSFELACATGMAFESSCASMALAVIFGEVTGEKFMIGTAYGSGRRADYPNLAGKLNNAASSWQSSDRRYWILSPSCPAVGTGHACWSLRSAC